MVTVMGEAGANEHKYISVVERYGKSSISLEKAFSLGMGAGLLLGS